MLIGSLLLPILFCTWIFGCERRPVTSEKSAVTVLARVNNRPLSKEEFDIFLPEDYQHVLTAEEKREYLKRWITTELLYEEALKSGMGMSGDIEARLEQYKKELLADRFLQKMIQEEAVVSEEEVRAYYGAHEDEYTKELRVSHILVNTREDAEEVQELLKTKPFAWVARRYSIDKRTRIGGDLGYLFKGNMLPEFEEVVFDMKVGDTSGIVESGLGYHIIKLTSVREARNKLEYEDVREEIANILMMKKREDVYNNLVTRLRREATIEILDDELAGGGERMSDSLLGAPY